MLRTRFHHRLGFAALCLAAVAGLAQPAERPRVALVLGGGGARGLAHVGVLKVLEEARIPVDCVVGTSMGALVGGVYATGKPAAEIEREVRAVDWNEVLDDRPGRRQRSFHDKQDDWLNLMSLGLGLSDDGQLLLPKGAIGTQKVDLLIRQLVDNAAPMRFDDLPLPFRAVAADLESGDMVVLSRGDVAAAMRASMAVPGVFPPVERDTRVLVDGGIARNLPIDVARGVCGDVVIAVDVGSPLLTRKQATDVLSISDQTVRTLTQRNVDEQVRQLASRDILIRPDLGALSSTDFVNGAGGIEAGEAAARELLPQLAALRVDEAAFAAWRAQLVARRAPPSPVRAVEVTPTRFVNPAVLKEALDVKLGQPLDVGDFHRKLGNVYARGDFEQIDYRVLPGADGSVVELQPHEKPWGPGYLDIGLGLRTDFDDDAAFMLQAQYRRAWINRLGGEWKTRAWLGDARGLASEFYQPATLNGELFAAVGGSVADDPIPLYFGERREAEYRRKRRVVNFDIGSVWGRWGEVRLGLERSRSRFSRATGASTLPDSVDDDGGVRFSLAYDQLDSARYPREGSYARLDLFHGLESLGADSDYLASELTLKHARRFGAWSGLLDFSYARGTPDAVETLPAAGGLFNLSSYPQDSIRAERIMRGRLRISQDVTRLAPLFGTAGFWGLSLEAARVERSVFDGNVDDDDDTVLYSTALFVGSDTRIGPAYFGIGYGGNHHARVYMSINGGF